ncbi:MAG: hypothetical protein MR274_01240 [Clostridium sp.]|nr:hypothetical protein [Clostridium sp.]MDY3827855.1 hypothetical protein [Clostridium sp.]
MKEIKDKIDLLRNSISKIENKEYGGLFNQITDILDDLYSSVEEMMENQAVLVENLSCLDEDISDIQEELFEELSIEDLEEIEDEYEEVKCKNCGKPIFMEKAVIKDDKKIECPYCKNSIR